MSLHCMQRCYLVRDHRKAKVCFERCHCTRVYGTTVIYVCGSRQTILWYHWLLTRRGEWYKKSYYIKSIPPPPNEVPRTNPVYGTYKRLRILQSAMVGGSESRSQTDGSDCLLAVQKQNLDKLSNTLSFPDTEDVALTLGAGSRHPSILVQLGPTWRPAVLNSPRGVTTVQRRTPRVAWTGPRDVAIAILRSHKNEIVQIDCGELHNHDVIAMSSVEGLD